MTATSHITPIAAANKIKKNEKGNSLVERYVSEKQELKCKKDRKFVQTIFFDIRGYFEISAFDFGWLVVLGLTAL